MIAVFLAACGGSDGGSNPSIEETAGGAGASDGGAGSSGGAVIGAPPPGQARATVDGLDFSFDEPGGIGCSITEDSFSYSFRIGDNEVTLGAGANLSEQGWLGAIELVVANPESGPGPISYFPELGANGAGIAVEGESMSYSGPMMKQPPQDGTNPAPVAAGDGTISVKCP
jgi:hypothetical protein